MRGMEALWIYPWELHRYIVKTWDESPELELAALYIRVDQGFF